MSIETKNFGQEGEDIAAGLLEEKGYEIIERNYRFGKNGEIDIIAHDKATDYLVFVEVKSRKNLNYGEPEYALTKNKIRQIRKMAQLYLYDKNISEAACRFDVVAILFQSKIKPVVNHYINAFT